METVKTLPTQIDADAFRAAVLFEEKGGFQALGKRVHLHINGRKGSTSPAFLKAKFGGTVYLSSNGQLKWLVNGDALSAFLARIRPYLTEEGLEKLRQVEQITTALSPKAVETAPAKQDAFNLLEGVDPDQLELVTTMFDALPRQGIDPDSPAVLRGRNAKHIHDWSVVLTAQGYRVEVAQDLILVHAKETV